MFGKRGEETDSAGRGCDDDFVIRDCGLRCGIYSILCSGKNGSGLGSREEGQSCWEVAA